MEKRRAYVFADWLLWRTHTVGVGVAYGRGVRVGWWKVALVRRRAWASRGRNLDGSGWHPVRGFGWSIYPRHCWHVQVGPLVLTHVRQDKGFLGPSASWRYGVGVAL